MSMYHIAMVGTRGSPRRVVVDHHVCGQQQQQVLRAPPV